MKICFKEWIGHSGYLSESQNRRMMEGGYEQFVQELKTKGWWNEYMQWLESQGLATGYGF
jgi:hypothetical protein